MQLLILITFIIGYGAIAFEHNLKINKAATALVTGIVCWTLFIVLTPDKQAVVNSLTGHLGELSQILFFLMGAMTVVELIDAHDGFEIITRRINTRSQRKLIWLICILTFILSAVLDNLTTTIVMVSLVRKLIANQRTKLMFVGAIVIAANAGGAWSPIGDVTTTMLWIGGQITAPNIIVNLILPSLVCLLIPLLALNIILKGYVQKPAGDFQQKDLPDPVHRNIVFFSGICILLLVPVFKTVTHLPPFMGILLGLGILWIIVEILHSGRDEQDRRNYTVAYA
ncbi:MAG: sodium:proton antiporter NhaD, partial [Chitinophagaceae bacterium]|nr:sodium:proton antiporter NhaD [Chitinophagaceae bacterium]